MTASTLYVGLLLPSYTLEKSHLEEPAFAALFYILTNLSS